MKANENIVICGDKVILVPYRAEHVPTYHDWMQDPKLLELTASEPLTYEEELEMQRKWHDDEDKLTFILLERPKELPSHVRPVLRSDELRASRMVGDVNMFLNDGHGECEIMTARPEDRRRGFAREALILFLSYALATLHLDPTSLIARIGENNHPSIALFLKLGFTITKRVDVWHEVELRYSLPDWAHALPPDRIGTYDPVT